jgi:DNA modification methylase
VASRGGSRQPAETLGGGVSGKTKTGKNVNHGRRDGDNPTRNAQAIGLKHKDLCGVPWRVALALQSDGWYLRQDIIWHKPNPMPESVRDRCTKAHEYIFLLSKSPKYYYDHESIKEPSKGMGKTNIRFGGRKYGDSKDPKHATKSGNVYVDTGKRNKRSVWSVTTKPFRGAHFATFPPDLIKPCILAGCPEGGTVLDPFMGSGTTLMVSEENGRNSLGIELNEEYRNIAEDRLRRSDSLFSNLSTNALHGG